jgi:hypothetical protein
MLLHSSPHQSEKEQFFSLLLLLIFQVALESTPVGIGTTNFKKIAVAGLHRACPSTSLDKSFYRIFSIYFFEQT